MGTDRALRRLQHRLVQTTGKPLKFRDFPAVSGYYGDGIHAGAAAERLLTGFRDQPLKIIVAEMVREKILTSTGEEIPYVTAVVTEKFDETDPEITEIYCAIYVERSSQKSIIIGKGGARVKDIGTQARHDIERLLGKKVFLKLFVKVVEDWRNRGGELDEMGIRE